MLIPKIDSKPLEPLYQKPQIPFLPVRVAKDHFSTLTSSTPTKPLSYPFSCLIKAALYLLIPLQQLLLAIESITDKIFQKKHSLDAQEAFRNSLQLKDLKEMKHTLEKLITTDSSLAPPFLVDFLCRSAILPHLKELMCGANMQIHEQTQSLFQQFSQGPNVISRSSSHSHKPGTCYSLETPLFQELLFWKDKEGHLRLQFEAHSLNTCCKIYHHFIDCLRYKLDGLQQGPYGSSPHTDAYPIQIYL